MRLLCITPYPHSSADTRYRIEQYLPGLKKAGIQADVRPFMSEKLFTIYAERGRFLTKFREIAGAMDRRLWDVIKAKQYDLIFLHKEAFMFGPPWLEKALRGRSGALVYDMDDAYWSHPPQMRQIGKALRDPHKIDEIIAFSDQILAGNGRIAEYARRLNPNVTILPTVIDTNRYQPRTQNDNEQVTIGWVGRWSSAFYLDKLIDVFREICGKHPQVQIKLIGAGDVNWPGVKLISQPWCMETEIEDIKSLTIGLMPLEDDGYARYKCGLKLLQYMGVGMPSVASPIGVNSEIIQDGINGYLANTPSEWYDRIDQLIDDPSLRTRLGAQGRHTVETQYSLENTLPLLIQTLHDVVNRKLK
jgi:glycosyltransferase involved in cell wall biosynthesis